jgi:hypothetical protein
MNQPRHQFRIHLAIFYAMAGFLIDLIEADFLSLAARGKQSHRARDKRKFQIPFPIRAGGHGVLHNK